MVKSGSVISLFLSAIKKTICISQPHPFKSLMIEYSSPPLLMERGIGVLNILSHEGVR
jgi:hypothetical protein